MVVVGLPAGSTPSTVEPGYLLFIRIILRGSLVGNQVDIIETFQPTPQGKLEVPYTVKRSGDLRYNVYTDCKGYW